MKALAIALVVCVAFGCSTVLAITGHSDIAGLPIFGLFVIFLFAEF